jgi:hypothetical protein
MRKYMNISTLQEFYRSFYITAPEGNNAFSYDARSHKKIYIPPLIKGSIEDVMIGEDVVFSDIVEGQEVSAVGLRKFVHLECPGQDIFIFDNHNHAFSFWAAGVDQGVIRPGSRLVHVDQHKDTREPAELLRRGDPLGRPNSVHEACQYANHILNVGNFIPPAVKLGWFKDVVQVGGAEAFAVEPSTPFVLDIDLDVFAPVMDYIPEDVKISRLRHWISRASFITIATSPFFMDQAKAFSCLRELVALE